MLTLTGLIYLSDGTAHPYVDGWAGADEEDAGFMISTFRRKAAALATQTAGGNTVYVVRLDISLTWS